MTFRQKKMKKIGLYYYKEIIGKVFTDRSSITEEKQILKEKFQMQSKRKLFIMNVTKRKHQIYEIFFYETDFRFHCLQCNRCLLVCLFVYVFFPLVHFVKMVHVLKEIKTLYRVFGPWAFYLAYGPSQARALCQIKSPRSKYTIKSLYFL